MFRSAPPWPAPPRSTYENSKTVEGHDLPRIRSITKGTFIELRHHLRRQELQPRAVELQEMLEQEELHPCVDKRPKALDSLVGGADGRPVPASPGR